MSTLAVDLSQPLHLVEGYCAGKGKKRLQAPIARRPRHSGDRKWGEVVAVAVSRLVFVERSHRNSSSRAGPAASAALCRAVDGLGLP